MLVSSDITVPDGGHIIKRQACGPGQVLISGGYQTDVDVLKATGWSVLGDGPVDVGGSGFQLWQVDVMNVTGQDVHMTVWAICIAAS
jgi:hypothetical protein